MNNSYWPRLLSWRPKNGAGLKPTQIKFDPHLLITREDTWT